MCWAAVLHPLSSGCLQAFSSAESILVLAVPRTPSLYQLDILNLFAMALVALPSSIIQTARDLKEILNKLQNAPKELNDLTIRLDLLADSAARIETVVAPA